MVAAPGGDKYLALHPGSGTFGKSRRGYHGRTLVEPAEASPSKCSDSEILLSSVDRFG